MILEQRFKHVHFDWGVDLEEVSVVCDGFKGNRVQDFIRGRTRKGTSGFGPLSGSGRER